MNKRGEPNAFLISIIIILVTLLIIFIWLYKAGYLLARDSDFRLCQLTIQTQDSTKFATLDSPLTLNCKRRFIRVEPDKAVQYSPDKKLSIDRPITVYKENADGTLKPAIKYSATEPEEYKQIINSVFAESMRRCWQMVGEGKTSIFNDESLLLPENTCLVCDQIDVDTGGRLIADSDPPILTNSLSKTMPQSDPPLTYSEYLFSPTSYGGKDKRTLSGGKLCLEAYDIKENIDLTTGTYVTVAFHSTRKLNPSIYIVNWAKIYSFFGGQTDKLECQDVYVVPADKMRSLCDYVAN